MTTQGTEQKKTHFNEPIDEKKALSGNNRRANINSAPPEVQQKVVDMIIEEARNRNLHNRDVAYFIAIVKRESGLNPDAANANSTASGLAQVIDKTGKTYGINDTNRFDARSNIRAGLSYFIKLKQQVIKDYGTAVGEYEPLVYYCYHYGEYKYYRDRKDGKDPLPFAEIKSTHKYDDSRTVVDEAARIEKILNSAHGLQVELTDILGKPLSNRKVYAVLKKPKLLNEDGATPQTTLQQNSTANVAPENTGTPPEASSAQVANGAASSSTDAAQSTQANAIETEASTNNANCSFLKNIPIEYELITLEFTTDSEGNIPEIVTDDAAPVMILIPRINQEEYIEALQKQLICESGNRHTTEPRGENITAILSTNPTASTKPQPATSSEKAKAAVKPSTPPPSRSILDAAATVASHKPMPPVNPSTEISINDVIIAFRQKGWKDVYETSFSYIKQFYTKPKLGTTPLDSNPARKAPPLKQTINSSLSNKETKTTKVKEKVVTTEETAHQPVEVHLDAPWMEFALAEQKKTPQVIQKDGNVFNDPEWKAQHKEFQNASTAIKDNQTKIKTELQKKEMNRDQAKIKALEEDTKRQEMKRDEAISKMREREEKFNNSDIVKYLRSTNLPFRSSGKTGGDAASDDTAWCSSFVNWCVEQTAYRGTKSAAAKSWLNWGKELPRNEPRYGAITVVYRGTDLYHVGFFTGIVKKNSIEGYEEIETKDKNGKMKIVKKPKFKQVEHVRLLSGNMSNMIQELAQWSVEEKLVSYRWPTAAEKK